MPATFFCADALPADAGRRLLGMSSPTWPDGLEHALAASPSTAFPSASRSWANLPSSPLDAPDRASVSAFPRAFLTISLQTSKPNVGSVLKDLIASSALLDACLPVLRAALEPAADGQPVPPPSRQTNVGLLLRYCVQQSGDGAHERVARCIICALSRRLSLNPSLSAPVLKILGDGLGAKKRSGLVCLEPLRRLCLLAAARGQHAAPLSTSEPDALFRCIELVASADTAAPEYRPLPPGVLAELVPSALGKHAASDPAALPSVLQSKLAPLLTAAESPRGGGYPWAAPPDTYLVSATMHGAIERAIGTSSPLAAFGSADPACDDLIRAAGDDPGELLCACVALILAALTPPARGEGRVDAVRAVTSAVFQEGLNQGRGDGADAIIGAAALTDERAATAARLLGALLVAPALHTLHAAAWRVCLDELLRLSLAAEMTHTGAEGSARSSDHVHVFVSRLLKDPLLSDAAEASAIAHWWPTVRAELQRRAAHSPALEALVRRAGRLVCSAMELAALPRPAKRKRATPLALTYDEALALTGVSAYYLPACLPLLRDEQQAQALVRALALSAVDGKPENLVAALHAASKDPGTPLPALCGLALLPLWYAQPPRAIDVYSVAAVMEALDVSGADLHVACYSTDLLRRLYLPSAQSALLATRCQRAELLHELAVEWMARCVHEVGPAAACRVDLLGRLARETLPHAVRGAMAEADGDVPELRLWLTRLDGLVDGMIAIEASMSGPTRVDAAHMQRRPASEEGKDAPIGDPPGPVEGLVAELLERRDRHERA